MPRWKRQVRLLKQSQQPHAKGLQREWLRPGKAEQFAILLVDLKMPGPDGLEVLRAARSMQPEAAVIIMTAYATVDTAVQAM